MFIELLRLLNQMLCCGTNKSIRGPSYDATIVSIFQFAIGSNRNHKGPAAASAAWAAAAAVATAAAAAAAARTAAVD